MTLEEKFLLEFNGEVYQNPKLNEYHDLHIKLVRRYALLLNKKLNAHLDVKKIGYASLAHDILKESGLDPDEEYRIVKGIKVPQDVVRYVRTNLDVLEEFKLDDYFNSSCQYHALAAGIFVYKEFGIRDYRILYPIFFHSCPIVDVYNTLDHNTRTIIDIIMLSDKLSSNYLKINYKYSNKVKCDLDACVFGVNGNEFNYTLGLVLARLISAGNSKEEESNKATKMYLDRLVSINPLISNINKNWGDEKKWEKRKSQAWRTF